MSTPDLTGRTSRCCHRHAKTEQRDGATYGANRGQQFLWGTVPVECPSSTSLPFFEHRPDEEHDKHYCGCFGWS